MDKKGRMSWMLLAVMTVIAVMMVSLAVAGTGSSSQVGASVTLGATCGISANESSIAFGTVNAGAESAQKNLLISNTGSVDGDVTIEGTDWNNSIDETFAVGWTKYDLAGAAYGSKTNLTGSGVLHMDNLTNGGTDVSYLQMKVPTGTGASTYDQNITYTSTC